MLRAEDVAHLSDDQLREFGISAQLQASQEGPYAVFWRALVEETRRLLKSRRLEWLLIEQELMNAGELEGAIVEPGEDPVEAARQELRERPWWFPPGESPTPGGYPV